MISPGYAGIIQSARREASKLNLEMSQINLEKTANKLSTSRGLDSPGRKKNSQNLLYGNAQARSRIKLQLE